MLRQDHEPFVRLRFLLVGTRFAPPADALLAQGLAQGTPVRLVADETNPYDSAAVKVLVARSDVKASTQLSEALANFGASYDGLAPDEIRLGHLGASGGKPLVKALAQGLEVDGNLDWFSAGKPEVGQLRFGNDSWIFIECEGGAEGAKTELA